MTGDEPGAGRKDQLAGLGSFFAVDVHDPRTPMAGVWRPFSDLVDDRDILRCRAEAARGVLAALSNRPPEAIELSVAASVVHLGLTARLLSPLLGLAALDGLDQIPALADVRWQDTPGGAVPLSLPGTLLDASPSASPAWDRWADAVVTSPLASLSRAVATLTPSRRTRTGNVASAIHGAVTVLTSSATSGQVPAAAAEHARALGRLLMAQPALRSAAVGEPGSVGFRRRNCCLIYRAADHRAGQAGPVCGDCVLAASSARASATR